MAARDPSGTAHSTTCRTRSCCKCNGGGICKNCSCVKAGNACSNCLPSRRNGCHNLRNVQLLPGSAPSTVVTSVDSSISTSVNPPALSLSLVSLACDDAAVLQSTPTSLPDGIPFASPGGNTLPAFVPMTNSQFIWGELNASAFTSLLDSACKEVVHWRHNCFSISKGHIGKVFVNELACLFSAFASGSALEPVALKATIVLPHLVLQKPHRRSKPKDHVSSLERRMKLWEQGDLTELLKEGRAIQNRFPRFPSSRHQGNEQQVARPFAKMMFQGKTQALYSC